MPSPVAPADQGDTGRASLDHLEKPLDYGCSGFAQSFLGADVLLGVLLPSAALPLGAGLIADGCRAVVVGFLPLTGMAFGDAGAPRLERVRVVPDEPLRGLRL